MKPEPLSAAPAAPAVASLLDTGDVRHGATRLPYVRTRLAGRAVGGTLTIGLVNNMPAAGRAAAERQFRSLIGAAGGAAPIRLCLFTLPGIPQVLTAEEADSRDAREWDEIWKGGLDGLIITGTEPRAADLRDEPYWAALTELIDWAEASGTPTVFSCLAAHGSVLHADGIVRRRLTEKRFGVFDHAVAAPHPLLRGIRLPLRIPHSRWNELDEAALRECGYHILTRSAESGVDMFVRERRSLAVHLQGHPEYEAATLLLEYRRDVRRFLSGEQAHYPSPPQDCLGPHLIGKLIAFRDRAMQLRHPDLFAAFPSLVATPMKPTPWCRAASAIMANWLGYIRERAA